MIKCSKISKVYQNKTVFKDLDLEVKDGEIVGVIGESGSGKTTLFKILLGLEKQTTGCVESDISQISASFQENIFAFKFSIKDNINLILNDKISDSVISDNLNQLGINATITEPVENLSIGMQRRLSTIRAFLSQRNIILLDEPYSGLDENNIRLTNNYIRNNIKARSLIIFAHDLSRLKDLTSTIIKL